MNLTKGEFSLFNHSSQAEMLSEKGISISNLQINAYKEIRIYLIYDFFVEVLYNTKTSKMESINLNIQGIPAIFLE